MQCRKKNPSEFASALSTTQNDHNPLTCKRKRKGLNLLVQDATSTNLVEDDEDHCSNGWTGRGLEWNKS